jgi:hypothetical protein
LTRSESAQPAWPKTSELRLWLNKLDALRGPTESYSDVIFRLAKGEGGEE